MIYNKWSDSKLISYSCNYKVRNLELILDIFPLPKREVGCGHDESDLPSYSQNQRKINGGYSILRRDI